jgi:hypothetical protein
MGKGGGGGGPAPSSQTVTNTSIPEYARPYVERMLGRSEALTDINQNPYQAYGGERISGFSPLQQQAFARAAQQTPSGQIGTATQLATSAGEQALGVQPRADILGQQAIGYGAAGAQYGGLGAQEALARSQAAARQAAMYGRMGAGYGGRGVQAAEQGFGAGEAFARQATDPYATQAYMSPYMQNVVDIQKQEAMRDYAKQIPGMQAQAVRQGAFGGSRQAILQAEAQRNLGTQLGQIQATGTQKAFEDAQRQQQFGANLGLQGLQAGYGGLGLGMQGAGLGLQGVGQQLGAGQLGLAGTGQGIAGAQAGMQGIGQAIGAGQYGLAGLGTGLQAAGALGQLGQTQFGQEQAISAEQQKVGAVQQAQAQQALDLAYQDFLKQRNYPYQQLAFQSDMLRGLPLSQASQQIYTAPPSAASQLGGLGMSALGIYGMSGGFKAKGGVIKEMAKGGLAYSVGGDIKMMSTDQLEALLEKPGLTPLEVGMIEEQLILRRRMAMNPETDQIMAPALRSGIASIATGEMVPENMAGGGIVAFKEGGTSEETYRSFLEDQVRKSIENQMSGEAFNRSAAEKAKIEKSLKDREENRMYELMARIGAGTAAGTSQYGLSNLGAGLNEGVKSYGQALDKDEANRLKLLEAQLYADKSEDARRSSLTGQMTTSLGQMYGRDATLAAARAAAGDPDLKALQKAQALINTDDQIPALVKQRDTYAPGSKEYNAFNAEINAIRNAYFVEAGVKRKPVVTPGVQLPPEPEKKGFFSGLFGGSKEPETKKLPGVMKFDKSGNPV